MPANRNRTTCRAQSDQAQAVPCSCPQPLTGADLTAADTEPMRRYPHPIPMCAIPDPAPTEDCSPCMNRVLEQLSCQNQLLLDLLGAVNSLTAALLARSDKT